MFDTPASAAAEVRRLKLPEVFRAVWNGTQPEVLRREWRQPRVYFEICRELAERVPVLANLCPLYEQNGEAIIGCLNGKRFIRFYYEDAGLKDPTASVSVLGENYQQLVTSVLTELVEAGLWDEFDEVAGLLHYNHTKDLRALLEAYTDEHGEADLARFRASLK
jgi:hypothetical protein